jgi:hypothetical protein
MLMNVLIDGIEATSPTPNHPGDQHIDNTPITHEQKTGNKGAIS